MREALALAEKGAGYVSPNPMVGAVIVRGDKIIGRGYHKQFGGPHAEVNAIRNAKKPTRDATLYVNLEPCNHLGKTPPCVDAILAAGISRVVVGMTDPNPDVSGGGVRKLRKAGVRVDVGVLGAECKSLNKAFLKYVTRKTPYVTLKVAQTVDGKIADATGKSKWITSEESRRIVHAMRARTDAVLVGAETVRFDNPRLTVRNVKGRSPVRVIIAPSLDIPPEARIFKNAVRDGVIIFVDERRVLGKQDKIKMFEANGVEIFYSSVNSRGAFNLNRCLKYLANEGIASVLVEGGGRTFSEFIRQEAADELVIFIAPKIFGRGVEAFSGPQSIPASREFSFQTTAVHQVGGDLMIEAKFETKNS